MAGTQVVTKKSLFAFFFVLHLSSSVTVVCLKLIKVLIRGIKNIDTNYAANVTIKTVNMKHETKLSCATRTLH